MRDTRSKLREQIKRLVQGLDLDSMDPGDCVACGGSPGISCTYPHHMSVRNAKKMILQDESHPSEGIVLNTVKARAHEDGFVERVLEALGLERESLKTRNK